MKSILLIGLGQFGTNVAHKLNELGAECMAVDKNEEAVNDVLPFVTNALIGDSTDEAFMRSIDVPQFDVVIVAIGNDFQSSLETTNLVKELGAKKVVSRTVRDVQAKFLLKNGADEIVYPEKQLAEWTAIRYSTERILDFIAINEEFSIFEIILPEAWYGKSVEELNVRKKYDLNILGYKQGPKVEMRITAETVMPDDATVLLLGTLEDVRRAIKE